MCAQDHCSSSRGRFDPTGKSKVAPAGCYSGYPFELLAGVEAPTYTGESWCTVRLAFDGRSEEEDSAERA